jgi:opacity protein-like surface antigen
MLTRRSLPVRGVLVACALALSSVAASAQTLQPTTRATNQTFSANPFMLMFDVFNLEYERVHTSSSTFGASTSMLDLDGADYKNFQGFYRYYPQGRALNGFYLGARGGLHRVSADGEAGNAMGLGFEIGYTWLLGSKKHFVVSIGAGATRLFGGDLEDVSLTIPTLRVVNLGWSF